MSDFKKLKEELLSKEQFYSSLTDRKITGKEYEHILSVWEKFEIKTKKNDHLYVECDISLLADAFEKVRTNSLENYELCPSHYLSSLGLN